MNKEKSGGGVCTMKKRKLNYRFHNPNTESVTAEHILKVFMEVNEKKVEDAIQNATEQTAKRKERGRDSR